MIDGQMCGLMALLHIIEVAMTRPCWQAEMLYLIFISVNGEYYKWGKEDDLHYKLQDGFGLQL